MADGPRLAQLRFQVPIVLLVCALVFWVRLGADGLTSTEGHRAIPAWEMLENGRYLVPTLFEQPYLRKPPGIQWAIASSSAVFGQTELAARAVSAAASTGMALLALFFARVWFGARWALAAGLAQALLPWLWSTGRAAEIEALNNLATQASVLLLVHMLVWSGGATGRRSDEEGGEAGRRWHRLPPGGLLPVLAATSIAAVGLAKGPASAPCLIAVVLAACVVGRSIRPLARPGLWVALVLAGGVLGIAGRMILTAAAQLPGEPVVQGPGDFMWDLSRLGGVLLLGPTALVSALPLSLVLLFPFGSDAGGEAAEAGDERALRVARALAWACLLSLAVYTLAGLSNPRYALPAVMFIAPLAAYVWRGLGEGPWVPRHSVAGLFAPGRRAIARALALRHPLAWPAVLLVAASVWIFVIEPRRDGRSGREPGVALAEHLPDGAVVLADHLVEARPEVIWYAVREAGRDGRTVRPLWIPRLGAGWDRVRPGPGTLLLLRVDGGSDEARLIRERLGPGVLEEVSRGRVHKFDFVLYRVAGP